VAASRSLGAANTPAPEHPRWGCASPARSRYPTPARSHDAVNGLNRKCNAADKAPEQPWSAGPCWRKSLCCGLKQQRGQPKRRPLPHGFVPITFAGCEGVQRLRPGEGHVAGEAIVENLLQFLAFRLDLCGAHAHVLGCGRALRRRLGDERNHTGKETRPELDLAPRRRLSHNHKGSPEAWVGFNIRFRCIDHG
jgi:hypothetical protein